MKKITEIYKPLLVTTFIGTLTWLYYGIIINLTNRTSRKVKKIKNKNKMKQRVITEKSNKLLDIVARLTEKFDDREKVRLKLLQAGNPLKGIGVNANNYTSFKWICTIATLLYIQRAQNNWSRSTMYGMLTYFLIEWFLKRKKKKRHEEIGKEMDVLITNTIDYLQQGYIQSEIFVMLTDRLEKGKPLHEEIVRVKIKMSGGTLDKNVNSILDELQDRIGLEDMDNYCLALKQHEEAGKAIRMLKKQLELLRSEGNQKKKRETQSRANLNSLVVAIIVASIIILFTVPLVIAILNNPIFK